MASRITDAYAAALLALLVAGMCALIAALTSTFTTEASAHTGRHGNFDAGWLQKCRQSGNGRFDPIVFPGQKPAGHHHSYTGGDPSPDATFESLRAGGTTCSTLLRPGENKSLYWIESYFVNGVRVPFQRVNVYYKRGNITQGVHEIKPFPSGHKMIARKGTGNSLGQWFCAGDGEGSNGNYRSAPYRCNTDGPYDFVAFRIAFPQCSDGRLDAPNHMSHMAYARNGTCPATHPIKHSRIMMVFKYQTLRGDLLRQEDGTLIDGEHADVISAWAPAVVKQLVQTCIRNNRDCGDGPI
jgi:hypothetical protein